MSTQEAKQKGSMCPRCKIPLTPTPAPVAGGMLLVCPTKTCQECAMPPNRSASGQPAEAAIPKAYGYEQQLCAQLAELGAPGPITEHRFHEARKWRLDLAWPDIKVGVEIEGAVHRIESRFKGDLDKYTTAALQGWTILRFPTAKVRDGSAAGIIMNYLRSRIYLPPNKGG